MVAHSTLSSSFQPHRVNSRGSTHSKCLYQFDTRVIESQVESWLTVLETRPSNGFSLVSCCFEPSQLQRITSGLNTNFTLSPSHSFHKSFYYKSLLLRPQLKFYPQFRNANSEKTIAHVLEPIHTPQALNTGICIQQGELFYSAGLRRNRC